MAPKKKARAPRIIGGTNKLKIHTAAPELKLDLGCGQRVQEGFHGVDAHLGLVPLDPDNEGPTPGTITRFDLWSGIRWPWTDNSVSEAHCSHVIEHIDQGNRHSTYIGGQGNLFMFFFEELWRVMKPGATVKLIWPDLKSTRAFMDPTHQRYIPKETLVYLDRNWREANGLDHYLVKQGCDFVTESCIQSMLTEDSKAAAEVQQVKTRREWDFVFDQQAVLRTRKPA